MAARGITLSDGVLVLDRLRPEDMEAHLAGEDEEQARRFGWWPRRSGPHQFRALLAADERDWDEGGPRRRFAARAGGILVGGCELRLRGGGRAEASYWTFPEFRSRGYATRALRLLAEWAFPKQRILRVELHVEPDNAASLAVAARAGFAPTGRRTSEGLLVYARGCAKRPSR
ncbi:MAG: GNAT family N-acetyltransferase [Thermoleophilia bacterium]|nr:GNAT family N-acetyltransferase [Thermoleophilia bacterium]